MMKIAIIGGTESALRLAELLVSNNIEVSLFILQPPDPHEDRIFFDSTIDFVTKNNIKVEIKNKFTEEVADLLIKSEATVGCLINCRFLIPERFLNLLPNGFLVTHGSILPEYRGFAPLNWTILNKRNEVGLTLFKAAPKVDSGAILLTKRFSINSSTTASDVFKIFSESQPEMFLEALEMLKNSISIEGIAEPQSESDASYCCRRIPSDSEIDWKKSSIEVLTLLRASQPPYPYAYTFYNGEMVWITQAHIVNERKKYVGIIPGRVVEFSKAEGWVDVLCGDGSLRITKIVFAEDEMYPAELIKSYSVTLGLNYSEEVMKLRKEINELRRLISLTQDSSL